MIYKPNTASPDMETVIPYVNEDGSRGLPFRASGICSSKISKIRVGFMTDEKAVNDSSYNDGFSYKYLDEKSVSYKSETYSLYAGYSLPNSMFTKNKQSVWNARLYEKESFSEDKTAYPFVIYTDNENKKDERCGTFNYAEAYKDASATDRKYKNSFYMCTDYKPTSIIGYGTVQDFQWVHNSSKGVAKVLYSHELSSSSKLISNGYSILKIFPHTFHNLGMGTDALSKGYDSYYARYYIEINGSYYKILDWKYYFWAPTYDAADGKYTDNGNFNSKIDTDGYGNPLAMYVLIRGVGGASISTDDTYTIYCNYTDSDDYTFKYTDETVVSFYDATSPNSEMAFYKTQDEALINENAYTTKYSNINISGVYPQNGTYVSKYKVSLYQVSGNNKLTLINSTGYEFGQNINYLYDEFMNGKKYLLHFEITNSDGNILNYYRCISTSYGAETRLIRLDTSINKKNNSVIVDYSNLFSIAPKERIHGDYEFITNGDDEPYLHLHNGNALTYDEIDGEDKLKIENPLTNIVIKLNSYFTGNICSTKDDNGNEYKLDWDGIKFIYTALNKKYTYYPYDKEESEWLDTMLENMKVSTIKTDVPYIWSEDFSNSTFDSKLYIHTEEPASEYWWSITMYNDGVYFKNLTLGENWVNATLSEEVS